MRIAITGATGLLGRNLLFEIIKNNLNKLDDLTLFVFSRPKESFSHSDRIKNIINYDGIDYIGRSPSSDNTDLMRPIVPISFDLAVDNLSILEDDLAKLDSKPIDYFFHIAAFTDFRSGAAIESKLEEINVKGTERICHLAKRLKVKNFIYVGSAYACGNKTGLIEPDYIDLGNDFRNPYERSKLNAEIYFRNFVNSNKINYKVFRPSTICGRLIEKPLGRTSKYDVFYSWIAFFVRQKMKHLKRNEDIYSSPLEMPIRLHFNPKGGLNIVPVDYCAKVMYDICLNNEPDHSYHLANTEITPNIIYGDYTFKMLNISKYQYVLNEPSDKNSYETLYYRTVGKLFTPYGVSDPIIFNVNNLSNYNRRSGISCPEVNKDNFSILVEYAKKDYFGLRREKDEQELK